MVFLAAGVFGLLLLVHLAYSAIVDICRARLASASGAPASSPFGRSL
jgi:hypothetical protein